MDKNIINIALFGLGRIGQMHAENLFSHKRKSLKNLLKKYDLKNKFDLNFRVEDLKLNELINIFRAVNS